MQDVVSRVLTQTPVIEAAESFVCIRPLTYENANEANYLRKMLSRGGRLENTVFAVMDPGATKYHGGPDRVPYHAFPGDGDTPTGIATGLKGIARQYSAKSGSMPLPAHASVRHALNVAACDRRPAAILVGTESERARLREKLASLAWSQAYAGQFQYAEASTPPERQLLGELPDGTQLVVVQPDAYGRLGKVLATGDGQNAASTLDQGLRGFKPWTLEHRSHLQQGVRQNIRWRSAIPPEDPGSVQAIERLWSGG